MACYFTERAYSLRAKYIFVVYYHRRGQRIIAPSLRQVLTLPASTWPTPADAVFGRGFSARVQNAISQSSHVPPRRYLQHLAASTGTPNHGKSFSWANNACWALASMLAASLMFLLAV
eukprot:scaffold13647_cov41-Prasinocladus_malaysianus.AAC.1